MHAQFASMNFVPETKFEKDARQIEIRVRRAGGNRFWGGTIHGVTGQLYESCSSQRHTKGKPWCLSKLFSVTVKLYGFCLYQSINQSMVTYVRYIWKCFCKIICGLRKPQKKKKTKYIIQRIMIIVSTFCAHGFTTQLATCFARDGSQRSKLSIITSIARDGLFDTSRWNHLQLSRCPIIVSLYSYNTCLQRSSVLFHTPWMQQAVRFSTCVVLFKITKPGNVELIVL